ncbi:hypothetical protein LSH36_702g01005 [Paralvinella palmiformis]|uniref:G-protein coupled receptors family 1 profile domain-containing protein n=1 Tax=Paralvinella palmiformis TaxID=53620 RepID=A0AAD9J1T2_9ANNE|nr:hypothetical protein LSH36_702g01005 [Paralvinella palmiformis]
MLVMFLVPVVIMVYCYTVVIHVLWISTKQLARLTNTADSRVDDDINLRLTSSNHSRPHVRPTKILLSRTVKDHSAEIREARKQVIRMLLAIITVFFLCWGPKLVFNLLKRHEIAVLHTDSGFYTNLVVSLLPYVQSCSNPIIYSFMSKNIRRSMRTGCRLICRVDPCRGCVSRKRRQDFDMETKGANGTSTCHGRYSPSSTSRSIGRSYVTVMSEM